MIWFTFENTTVDKNNVNVFCIFVDRSGLLKIVSVFQERWNHCHTSQEDLATCCWLFRQIGKKIWNKKILLGKVRDFFAWANIFLYFFSMKQSWKTLWIPGHELVVGIEPLPFLNVYPVPIAALSRGACPCSGGKVRFQEVCGFRHCLPFFQHLQVRVC